MIPTLTWKDRLAGAAIAIPVFGMMESTTHMLTKLMSSAFNTAATPEHMVLAAGVALCGLVMEGYAGVLAGKWAAIGHSVSGRKESSETFRPSGPTPARNTI